MNQFDAKLQLTLGSEVFMLPRIKKLALWMSLFGTMSFADTPPIIYQFAAPLIKTNNKNVSIPAATSSVDGYLNHSDWMTFNSKAAGGNYVTALTQDVNASGPGSASATVTGIQTVPVASTAPTTGQALVYNGSQWAPATQSGGVTSVTASSPLASSGGSTPNITAQVATTSQNGYLSSTDWNTFNGKQAAGSYLTALTGDITASGPGSASATLANSVNVVYVDFISGSDSTGTGTAIRPWKTLQKAYNSITPSINVPYTIHLSGGNNDTDTAITAKPNVSIFADYSIQISPSFTISGGTTNDGATFTNINFVGAFNWTRNDNSQIGVTFNNCQFFAGPTVKQTGAGVASVFGLDSTFVNSEFQLSHGGFGVFPGTTFLGSTTFDDPGTGGTYYQLIGGYNDGAMSISGPVDPVYFAGFVQDTAFGASLTFVTTANGTPTVETDSSGLPPTYTGSPSVTLLSQAKYEAYSPTTPSLWPSPPTTVGGALDYVASTEIQSIIKANTSGFVLYISTDAGSDTTGDGSFARPFKTISKGITVATAIPSTVDTPVVIKVMPGQYTENLSFTQQGITLEAMSNDYHSWPVFINGNVTINLTGTAGGGNFGAQDNNVTINGFEMISSNSSPVITFSGSTFQRLFLNHCLLYNNSTGTAISETNTGTNSGSLSTITVRDTDFKSTSGTTLSLTAGNMFVAGANPGITQVTSGGIAANNAGSGALTFANSSISGEVENTSTGSIDTTNTTIAAASGSALVQSSTGSMTIALTTMTASTSGAVVNNTSTGAITFESCVVTNNTSTGQGLIDTGGTITSANVIWTIGTGSGSYVAKGTGIFAYAFNIFTSQTKLQNTLTIVALTTTPTTGP